MFEQQLHQIHGPNNEKVTWPRRYQNGGTLGWVVGESDLKTQKSLLPYKINIPAVLFCGYNGWLTFLGVVRYSTHAWLI